MLHDVGFEVVTASSGGEALERFHAEGPFDVVLLDDDLPGLRGVELLARLRAAGCTVPAVLHSGTLVLSDRERAILRTGPVLAKPASIDHLIHALRSAIARAKRGGD